jgi:hypothetical protein
MEDEYGESKCLNCGRSYKTWFQGMPKGWKGTSKDCIKCKIRTKSVLCR